MGSRDKLRLVDEAEELERATADFYRESGHDSGLTGEWSVPWSDLMMVMFVLFVVLFVYQIAERDTAAAAGSGARFPEPSEISAPMIDPLSTADVFARSRELVREADLDDVEVVLEDERTVRLSIRGPLFFDLGRAELRPPTRDFLREFATVVRETGRRVHVAGHTDDFPVHGDTFPTNWELSAVRAVAVVRFLIEECGIEPERLSVSGHSMYRPAMPNTSGDNRARNRRVELLITERPLIR